MRRHGHVIAAGSPRFVVSGATATIAGVATGEPTWRQVFDVVEDLTASQLDRVMRTELFAQALSLAVVSTARTRRGFDSVTGRCLRFWNMPSRADVQDLADLLLSVERRLRELDGAVRDRTGSPSPPP